MRAKLAINGVGRIGRALLRVVADRDDLEVVAVNDPTPVEQTAHLLRHDSTLGPFPRSVEGGQGNLLIGGDEIAYSSQSDPASINWSGAEPSLVVEASGRSTARDESAVHLRGSVERVLVSANSADADALVCFGVNHQRLNGKERVISASSCTTNCAAAVLAPLVEPLAIDRVMLMTVHCYNSSQSLVDAAQPDLRRARAAGLNLIPTTTGASWALERVLPDLADRVSGYAVRVPAAQVSLIDLMVETGREMESSDVLDLLREAEAGQLAGILAVSEEPLVSSDFVGAAQSAIVDAEFVRAEGRRLRLLAWYDNEMGYANRLADLAAFVAETTDNE